MAKAAKPAEKVKVTLNLPVDLVKTAKKHAIDLDVDLQDLVETALRAQLAKAGGR
jgi:hypothetical protein